VAKSGRLPLSLPPSLPLSLSLSLSPFGMFHPLQTNSPINPFNVYEDQRMMRRVSLTAKYRE